MNTLREQAILNAISNWTDKKNGIYQWWEFERYSAEFCEIQIIFFINLN